MTDEAPRIVIVSGVAPHIDPWHQLGITSAALAKVLRTEGRVEIVDTNEASAAADADLIVVNATADLANPPSTSRVVVEPIAVHHAMGKPILAMHSSLLAFPDDPRWARMIGGRWVPGTSMHPEIGMALVSPYPDAAPAGMPALDRAFSVYDERYTALERFDGSTVLAVHTEQGTDHPLIWWRASTGGRGVVAYDALGHTAQSLNSLAHCGWLRRSTRALLATISSEPF